MKLPAPIMSMPVTITVVAAVLMATGAPAQATDLVEPAAPAVGSQQWQEPDSSMTSDPGSIVDTSGERGAMTVAYAVTHGDSLTIRTVEVPNGRTAEEVIAEVQQDPDAVAVEVASERTIDASPAPVVTPSADPYRPEQWALDVLRADEAWQRSTGAGITVAVLDTGVARHPDLAGKFVRGADFVTSTDGRKDLNGHGTHVAGIIAMTANNKIGGAGMAPDVSIMPVRVADAEGSLTSAASAQGIRYAVDNGAAVINMSYSGSYSATEKAAVDYALSKGATLVAAVGNAYRDGSGSIANPVQYPAAFPGVLGVAAYDPQLKRADYSEVGLQVDVAGPGGRGGPDSATSVFSTYPNNDFYGMSGTSMATPYVSATAALTLSRAAQLAVPASASNLILATATDLGAPGRDNHYGFGALNPVAALDAVPNPPASVIPTDVDDLRIKRLIVRVRKGWLRYRIPAAGRFRVGWQQRTDGEWSSPQTFKGKKSGNQWYTATTNGRFTARIIAVRAKDKDSNPIWSTRVFKTRR